MTNQQLKAHCEDVIANPQEHSDIVLAMAKALLPCLEAEPVANTSDYYMRELKSKESVNGWLVKTNVDPGFTVSLYTDPPVPELKPIECPAFDGYVPHIAKELQGAFKNAVIRAGYEVKS